MGKREDNLTPFDSNQSREEAAKNGRKGGIASGEARRRKKTAKQAAEVILYMPTNKKNSAMLSALGVDEADQTNMVVLMAKMFAEAVAEGNVKAAEFLMNVVGGTDKDVANRERVKIEKKRLAMEEGKRQGGDDVVTSWVEKVIAKDEDDGGDS